MNGIQEAKTLEDSQNVNTIIGIGKKCSKCGEWKRADEFYLEPRLKCGLSSSCKECQKKYRELNKEKIKERSKLWFAKNIDKRNAYARKWSENNPEKKVATNKEQYLKNKEKRKEYQREWRALNSDKHKESVYLWRKLNPEKTKEYAQITGKRIRSTPKGKLNCNIRRYISSSLNGNKKGHWETLVGYTVDELKRHLEKRFTKEMNWNNYGSFWHIDHIIPINAFNFKSASHRDFKRCWSLKNLRPLEAKENIRKGHKLNKHFQPSLSI